MAQRAAELTALTGIPHQVDHMVPLQHKLVCGLHTEANLKVLPRALNQSKSNRFWPDCPDHLLQRLPERLIAAFA